MYSVQKMRTPYRLTNIFKDMVSKIDFYVGLSFYLSTVKR